jgi:hypothetical protein
VFGDHVWLTAPAVVSADGPSALEKLTTLKLCNAIAIHPYGIRPEQNWPHPTWGFGYIGDVLALYKEAAERTIDKQIEVSELGLDKDWFSDEHQRAVGHSKMLARLASLGAARAAVFCYHDVMHDKYGMLDLLNVPSESYAAVWTAGPTIDTESQAPPVLEPLFEYVQGLVVGARNMVPRGAILHGSRSGRDQSVDDEYRGTVGWVANGTNGVVGWNFTIGNHEVAQHMGVDQYGWHARAASRPYVGMEFAQGVESQIVTDAQVETFAWVWRNIVEARYPTIPPYFPTHAEVERNGETGQRDGKSDVYSTTNRAEELRARIAEALSHI